MSFFTQIALHESGPSEAAAVSNYPVPENASHFTVRTQIRNQGWIVSVES